MNLIHGSEEDEARKIDFEGKRRGKAAVGARARERRVSLLGELSSPSFDVLHNVQWFFPIQIISLESASPPGLARGTGGRLECIK